VSTDIARMAWLMKAKRAADEASEALRLMIEHDLAITVPDSPDMNALHVIADGGLFSAREYLRSAHAMPDVQDVDSETFVRLKVGICGKLRGAPRSEVGRG
jgi:hypothetical protein